MQQNYACLDRRYATSQVIQSTNQLPYALFSYYLSEAKYNTATIYFLNFATDDPTDAATIEYFTSHDGDYSNNTVTRLPYVFVEPNILLVDTGSTLNGNIILSKTTALAYCTPVNPLLQVIYPLNLQSATYAANFITLTLSAPKIFSVVKSLSTSWTVTQDKYRSDSVFIPLKKIKKIKLQDFMFYNWLTDNVPNTGAQMTILINEYSTNAFQSPAGNYHFIFNINNKLLPPDNSSIPITLSHLEGNIYPVSSNQTYVNNNVEYEFNPPVDIKDTLSITLGVLGVPLAINTGLHISHMKFYISLIDWNSNFQIWIQDNDLIRRLVNGFTSDIAIISLITITELTTTNIIKDQPAITYATSPNGFLLYMKNSAYPNGSVQPPDPNGYCSPFGYVTSLLQKSGEQYPTYPVNEFAGQIVTCKAFLNLLNYRYELIFQGV